VNLRHALAALVLGTGLAQNAQALPSFAEVHAGWRPSDARVLDRHGELLQRVRIDHHVRRGEWIALADVSPALRMALVLSEDKRFYEHSGVDWRAVSAAAWGNLWNSRTRGASTITMQLAALLDEPDGELQRGAGGRRLPQKIGQALAAQQLERRWRKDQILEAYLNLVPFKGELVGIDALSRTLFGKAAHGLDESEAAVAAALVRAPNAKTTQVAQRACGVVRLMQAGTRVDCGALQILTTIALQNREFSASEGIAPHHARRVLASGSVQTVRSTVSAPLQRFALHTLQRHLRELKGRNVQDGALVVLDNASGEVLAWIGSSGELSAASEVDGVLAPRQPGSTLKPFLYGQAIAERRMTAASLLEDSPAAIPTTSGLYIPQNYDRRFKGWVSARTALASSLNVPAVRTLVMVSPDAFHRQLGAVGLPLREPAGYYGYSLALGSAEVPLLSLTNAFRTLANGGRYGPVGSPPQAAPAIDPRAAFIVGDILSDGNARARTFGTDSILATRFWAAVKTGTSKDMRDNWAVGWSERYSVGVWVGNASGAPMWNVSGTSGAAPVWTAVMQHLHAHTPSRAPRPPAGLVQAHASFDGTGSDGPLEAARSEWFIAGTEQARFAMNTPAPAETGRTAAALHIRSPAPGTIVALDPDIPPNRQRLNFVASGAGGRWRLDGKPLAQGAQVQWLPWPGKHVMQLTDARGTVLDEVRFEVRGAGVKERASAALKEPR
jgi:penicillin-binding protein 1C